MKNFKSLDNRKVSEVEKSILDSWGGINNILNKTIENRKNAKSFVFYDGPATANGMPGVHHMLAKELKDIFCKYKTMQGFKVLRKVGWDTHGLPVELQVEKELGFKSKADIEKYGIKEFNNKCRECVWENESAFRELTEKMGQFIDLENPYVTYDNNYIETGWWILKKFFDEGLIYEGYKVLPYCPRCGTGLASHEVAQGYKDITVNTVIVPFKLKNEDTYLLVWTTTPWTLLANTAVCVNPNEEYLKVKSIGYNFIVAKKLANKILGDDYQVLETYQGKDLEYQEYEQLMPFLTVDKKGFYVTCDNYVTMEDGTGIVHIAPAFGQDDYEVAKKYNLPVLNPVGEDGKYTDGPWKGRSVIDSELEIEIIKYLKENDKLFKKEKMTHNYPHCWRCGTPLLYYSKPSLYIATTKYKEKVIEQNNKVNWFPPYVGEKRFGNWLENMNDWAISRNRYWGTPIPLWKCSCGYEEMIGSKKELIEKSIEKIDDTIELHRPYVDDIHLKCPKCGKSMTRVKEVMDCWFDSGAMPFAQYHYPFENEELFDNQFPADFICEGVDQTRGWFYTLILISTFIKGISPYKNVLVNDMLLDKNGQKMHKSKGNAIMPFALIEEYGADAIRWYMPYVSPVWTPIKFDVDGLKEVYSKFFNTLKNTYNFFVLYANTDNIDIDECNIDYKNREEIDKWLISKYHNLLKYVTNSYEEYDPNKVVRGVTNFVNEDLSNWYIRRNRDRFWTNQFDNSKKSVYITTYEVLVGLCKIIAPIIPFLSEEMYRKLTGEESVHLADFPKYNESYIDLKLETKMDLVRNLISIGRMVREEAKIKVRQPLNSCLIDGKNKDIIGDLTLLIKEELNIKEVIFVDNLNDYMNVTLKPNFKEVGKTLGSLMKEFQFKLETLSKEDITKLQNNENIVLNLSGTDYEITKDMVEFKISSKEGYNAGMENDNFIILNTTLTDDLLNEGIARELVSKIQQIRKNIDLNVVDRIKIYYFGNDKIKEVFADYEEYIKKETLAKEIILKEDLTEAYNINENQVSLLVEKV
ncbi:MAG TPA: isoleucine--tRNA ligase [Bacilli bacterium]|nr:isoleucine--tRNA ligase [Bacilli bacterium]